MYVYTCIYICVTNPWFYQSKRQHWKTIKPQVLLIPTRTLLLKVLINYDQPKIFEDAYQESIYFQCTLFAVVNKHRRTKYDRPGDLNSNMFL